MGRFTRIRVMRLLPRRFGLISRAGRRGDVVFRWDSHDILGVEYGSAVARCARVIRHGNAGDRQVDASIQHVSQSWPCQTVAERLSSRPIQPWRASIPSQPSRGNPSNAPFGPLELPHPQHSCAAGMLSRREHSRRVCLVVPLPRPQQRPLFSRRRNPCLKRSFCPRSGAMSTRSRSVGRTAGCRNCTSCRDSSSSDSALTLFTRKP